MKWIKSTALIAGFTIAALLALNLSPKPQLFNWQSWSTAYFDQHGQLLRFTLADDDKYRLYTPLSGIHQNSINATLLYEDRDFFAHSGVSFSALMRAGWETYVIGNRRVGGSTISMQLARMAYDIPSSQLSGKLQQVLYALWIEAHYSKEEILTLYLNHLPYGGNIEGLGAASLIYFDKTPDQLNLAEILALTVIPQNPSKRYPITTKGQQHLETARVRLIQQWLTQYAASSDDNLANLALELPLHFRSPRALPFEAPHFVDHLIQHFPDKNNRQRTSLNLNTQHQLEQQVQQYLNTYKALGFHNASALLLNHRTMQIEAWLGSADYFNHAISGQVNGVTAKRSPGSTLKPFAYALAIDQGLIHPLSLLKDTPSRYAAYTPENYDMAYAGPINATDALITSRNVPAIRLAAQLNDPTLYQLLEQAEITKMKARSHYGLSSVLGGIELSMLELTRLYAILPNKGKFQHELFLQDQVSQEQLPNSSPHAVELLSKESAWLITDMLAKNPATDQPSLNRIHRREPQRPAIAWKTGTSFAFRDAWSIGYDEHYVLAVWLGNFDGQGNANLIGREAAAPLFFQLFRQLRTTHSQGSSLIESEHRPSTISKVKICEATGALPNKYCPNKVDGWFIPGVSPIKTSHVFRPVHVNVKTGLRSCQPNPKTTYEEVYQFWPTDLARLFKVAGIQHKKPPRFEQDCSFEQRTSVSLPPKITSPSAQLTYYLSNQHNEIPLEAVFDADVKAAYWFANGNFIAEVGPERPFFWKANPGEYLLTVTDDLGKTDTKLLTVEQRPIH